jgi:hypothetical protein
MLYRASQVAALRPAEPEPIIRTGVCWGIVCSVLEGIFLIKIECRVSEVKDKIIYTSTK